MATFDRFQNRRHELPETRRDLRVVRLKRKDVMIVCSCNVFSDKDIRNCLDGPASPRRPREVYTALGCAPKCGCCAETIAKIIQETQDDRTQDRSCDLIVAA
jgi:bacterioferritin-associated ferredoxin